MDGGVSDAVLTICVVKEKSAWPYGASLPQEDYLWVFSENELEFEGGQQLEFKL